MAYREVAMWEILWVLKERFRGENLSSIARKSGHMRKTVRRYVRTAQDLGWREDEEPDDELAIRVYQKLRPVASDSGLGASEELLMPLREQIEEWLKPPEGEKRGLRLTKVHELLGRKNVRVPYSSLHRFAVRHCGFADRRRITVRLEDPEPGEYGEIDFGRLGYIHEPGEGRRLVHALVVTLNHSRHQFVWPLYRYGLSELIEGLEEAWEFFGGCPRKVILDNMRSAIRKADRHEPLFTRVFAEYADWRSLVIDPARVEKPKDKPRVERAIGYVKDSFFAGERWVGLEDVRAGARRWCLEVAGLRIHGTTRRRPLAVFENIEKEHLLPLERGRFDPPEWAERQVNRDHMVAMDTATYSVPTAYIGRKVTVRADSRIVRIYYQGELIKTHARQPPGGRSIDFEDYPAEKGAYARRDPVGLIDQARGHGDAVGRFMEALLAEPAPWTHLRQAHKVLRMGEKYGWRRVEQAAERALAFEAINARILEKILIEALEAESGPTPTPPAPPAGFLRPSESFIQPPTEGIQP